MVDVIDLLFLLGSFLKKAGRHSDHHMDSHQQHALLVECMRLTMENNAYRGIILHMQKIIVDQQKRIDGARGELNTDAEIESLAYELNSEFQYNQFLNELASTEE